MTSPEGHWKRTIIVESPYGTRPVDGKRCSPVEIAVNRAYLDLCLLDCLNRDEVPIASHKLYVDCLDDADPEQRKRGLEAGFELHKITDAQAVYIDLGISGGMLAGRSVWRELHGTARPTIERRLPFDLYSRFVAARERITLQLAPQDFHA